MQGYTIKNSHSLLAWVEYPKFLPVCSGEHPNTRGFLSSELVTLFPCSAFPDRIPVPSLSYSGKYDTNPPELQIPCRTGGFGEQHPVMCALLCCREAAVPVNVSLFPSLHPWSHTPSHPLLWQLSFFPRTETTHTFYSFPQNTAHATNHYPTSAFLVCKLADLLQQREEQTSDSISPIFFHLHMAFNPSNKLIHIWWPQAYFWPKQNFFSVWIFCKFCFSFLLSLPFRSSHPFRSSNS